MTYTLAIADRSYSSWSLRGWLIFAGFDIPVSIRHAHMRTPAFPAMLEEFGAATTVPALRIAPDIFAWDSLAIAETVAEDHPGLWPEDRAARALARTLAAEMHSGFQAIRTACPMNLRRCYAGFEPSEAVLADLARVERLWFMARANHGDGGPWLFGAYSLADVFFAPMAMRIAGYGLPLTEAVSRDYVEAHLAHPAFRQWRAMGLAESHDQTHYHLDLPVTDWPGPVPVPAEAVSGERPINDTCPYSGQPVRGDSLARIDGVVIGYCNPFCRDKTVADPAAWPATMKLLEAFKG